MKLGMIGRILLISTVSACSSASVVSSDVPPRSVATIIDGLGFSFTPMIRASGCVSDVCNIVVDYPEIVVSYKFPSDVRFYGAGCRSSNYSAEPFMFESVEKNGRDIEFIFSGDDLCDGRFVSIKFSSHADSDSAVIGRIVRDMYKSWYSCSNSGGGLRCVPASAGGLEGRIRSDIEGWERDLAK